MKNFLIIIMVLLCSNHIAIAQLQNDKTIHAIKIHPMTIADVFSQRVQLSYEALFPTSCIAIEVGGAYIFNEHSNGTQNKSVYNYWANGWSGNTCIKFYDKKNKWYGGIQAKLKYNYMHWDVYNNDIGFSKLQNNVQLKRVLIGDIIGGYRFQNKIGVINEIGLSLGLRNRVYQYKDKTSDNNMMWGIDHEPLINTSFNNSEVSILPSIMLYYKIGFGFKSKK